MESLFLSGRLSGWFSKVRLSGGKERGAKWNGGKIDGGVKVIFPLEL